MIIYEFTVGSAFRFDDFRIGLSVDAGARRDAIAVISSKHA